MKTKYRTTNVVTHGQVSTRCSNELNGINRFQLHNRPSVDVVFVRRLLSLSSLRRFACCRHVHHRNQQTFIYKFKSQSFSYMFTNSCHLM